MTLILSCSYTAATTTALGQEMNKTRIIIDDIVGTIEEKTIGMLMNNTINMLKNSTSYLKTDNNGTNNITIVNLSAISDKLNADTSTFGNQTDNKTSSASTNTKDKFIGVNKSRLDDNLTRNDNTNNKASPYNDTEDNNLRERNTRNFFGELGDAVKKFFGFGLP
jgi:hypothetical protein